MKGIVVLAHGSRAKETEKTLETIVDMVRVQMPKEKVQLAYMEFGTPTIAQALSQMAETGCSHITVVPYFLFEGIHIREDIPEEIAKFTDGNPGVTVTLGKTLGADKRLAEILIDRIQESV